MTLRDVLDEYFNRLNLLNGLLFHLEVQLRTFKGNVRDRIERGEIKIDSFAAGASIVIRDLTEWPSHGWAVKYTSGRFTTMGEEFLALTDQLITREGAWTVSQAFESFETCALDLLAAGFYQHRGLADARVVERRRSGLVRSGFSPDQPSYWKTFVRREYRNVEGALGAIRSIAPSINNAEQANNRATDLQEWFSAVSEIRHAATHSNHCVRQSRLDQMTSGGRDRLFASFSGVRSEDGYALLIDMKQVCDAVTTFAEYGYSLYKALCLAAGVEWRVFRNQCTQ